MRAVFLLTFHLLEGGLKIFERIPKMAFRFSSPGDIVPHRWNREGLKYLFLKKKLRRNE
jgi:hypothetical protein